ncbi:hypothetical protein FHS61_000318 [Altererythrobacter atlanticus]|uniref:Uncharacterized protein n=1 Tax=Croceibacterium atlanticum TaxID=1267766 RepID=A0A0F7KPU4_9SPHN|nr:DUF1761 domain-containing protein [Croceibacterium atlanticum]AKH42548.1 hypothetical protein WYH_01509 [Croceibacterium atlanticum]MBB5731325.1 hypothetical protein [Croceibacterium atlanticum]
MGEVNLLAVFLGALAFFLIGAIWYGPLFGKSWRELNGIAPLPPSATGPRPGQHPAWLIMVLAFLFEMLISLMLGHNIARTNPPPYVIMMMAVGFGATIMTPAIGIHYLFQMRPGKLFFIDAGYFIVGMAAMGGVFIALG